MQSPFAVFRKHSKVLMVLLTGLAMFAFIILDQLRPEHFPVVLGFLVGAIAFWLVGRQTGKPVPYAVAGAILGMAVGMFGPAITGRGALVETSAGDLTRREVSELIQRRRLANQFLTEAYREKVPPFGGQFMQFWQQRLNQYLFHYGRELQQDVVFGYLLGKEAEKLGIQATNESVQNYIKELTTLGDEWLTKEEFTKIRRSLRVTEKELFQALRDELTAKLAFQTVHPTVVATPEEFWEYYRRLNVRQKLTLTAVPVDEFTGSVPEPTQGELEAFFDLYKSRRPSQEEPGDPGFLQPRKVKLAYLEADYETSEQKVIAELDREIAEAKKTQVESPIEEFYRENKENYRNRPLPDQDGPASGGPSLGTPPGATSETPDSPLDPQFIPETKPGADKPLTDDLPVEAPKPSGPGDGPAASTGNEPSKETEPSKEAEPPKPAPPDQPAGKQSDAKQTTGDAKEATENETTNDQDEASLLNPLGFPLTLTTALQADEAEATADAAGKPADDKPAPSKDEAPASNDARSKDSPSADATPDDKPAPADDSPPQDAEAPETAQADPDAPVVAPKPGETETAAAPDEDPPPLPEFRPLDEDLKLEIRDELIRQRTRERLEELTSAAEQEMSRLRDLYYQPAGPGRRGITPRGIVKQLKKFAEENNLLYAATPLLTRDELSESEEYPLGKATAPTENPFEQSRQAVVDEVFNSRPEQLYWPYQAEDPLTSNRFAYWKTVDVEEHTPMLQAVEVEADSSPQTVNDDLGYQVFPTDQGHETIADVLQADLGQLPEAGQTVRWRHLQITSVKGHVFRLQEPGIGKQVEEAWKTDKARPAAEKRAESLAEAVRESDKPMEEALADKTVTGKKGSPELTVRTTESFSWMRTTTVPSTGLRQQPISVPELSSISAVERPGHDFMRTVFEDLDEGSIGVAANADRSIYYVVKVQERQPSEPSDWASHRHDFMKEPLFQQGNALFGGGPSTYGILANQRRRELAAKWLDQFQKKYDVRWNTPQPR